jgi:catechol 2,3-dioxygenase-like lactoylglutathione lyase family enzyme
MIDHMGIGVTDLDRSIAFYEKALAPLGYVLIKRFGNAVAGFGASDDSDIWLGTTSAVTPQHVAFRADKRSTVRAFHAAGLAAGGADNGGPGVRPQYHEHYYGAFVLDPDGNNIEAVCHDAYLG